MIGLNNRTITPTIFPDKTSQVWKLDPVLVTEIEEGTSIIQWEFENEVEIIQVLQLATLCNKISKHGFKAMLIIPFLPYGRQDKEVSNETTFALTVFLDVLTNSGLFARVATVDAHNSEVVGDRGIINISANAYLEGVIKLTEPDVICFPDKGATTRGYYTDHRPSIHLDKVRNQSTGEIEGLGYAGELDLTNRVVLIVDDLVDAGRTFIEASKLLYARGAFRVCLFTTHGLYTKGTKVLFDSGIKRIFNHKGEVFDRT
jgi:ribose-phosphate pyrophosphokinase